MGNLANPQKTTDQDSVLKFTLYISLRLVEYLKYSHEMGMRKVCENTAALTQASLSSTSRNKARTSIAYKLTTGRLCEAAFVGHEKTEANCGHNEYLYWVEGRVDFFFLREGA